jgi:hypothetical protein
MWAWAIGVCCVTAVVNQSVIALFRCAGQDTLIDHLSEPAVDGDDERPAPAVYLCVVAHDCSSVLCSVWILYMASRSELTSGNARLRRWCCAMTWRLIRRDREHLIGGCARTHPALVPALVRRPFSTKD